jgi:hypothetical protein
MHCSIVCHAMIDRHVRDGSNGSCFYEICAPNIKFRTSQLLCVVVLLSQQNGIRDYCIVMCVNTPFRYSGYIVQSVIHTIIILKKGNS